MLPEVVETKRFPRKLPSIPGKRRPAPLIRGDTGPGCCSSPPKRFFGLANDIAPGQTDVMQVAIGPLGQFAALPLTVAPNVEGFAELGQNPRVMMIYHRFM
jgi:hypothetical protein